MKLTGGQIIAEYLAREHVPYIVGIPGHGSVGMIEAFRERDDIDVIQVRQEMSAVHLADGYYRASGQPLAAFTSIGPGAINTIIGLATCYVESTPALVLTGSTHTYMRGKGVLQEIERTQDSNFIDMVAPVVKRYWRPDSVRQLPTLLHRAFNQMMEGRRGPVLIDLPMDVQADWADVEVPDPAGHRSGGVQAGDSRDIGIAAQLLVNAKRPVLFAGGGAITAGAGEELIALAELIGAAVVTTFQGKGVFPETHPLSCRTAGAVGTDCGNAVCRACDVLVSVGARFADMSASSYADGVTFSIPPTKLIHIDIDSSEIGKNYPVEVGIVGDAKAVLSQLVEAAREAISPRDYRETSYFAEIQSLKDTWLASVEERMSKPLTPPSMSQVVREIAEFIDEDAFVVSAAGHPQERVAQEMTFTIPGTNLTSAGFSTMGFTLPAALGAKLAQPGRQVVGLAGDGDFTMTIQELATAAQYEIPVVMVVLDNQGWLSIRDLQRGYFGEGHEMATDFHDRNGDPFSPDFAAIAEGFGCLGLRVETLSVVKGALAAAFSSRKPAVIHAKVNRVFPDSGIPLTGWWDCPVPRTIVDKRADYDEFQKREVL